LLDVVDTLNHPDNVRILPGLPGITSSFDIGTTEPLYFTLNYILIKMRKKRKEKKRKKEEKKEEKKKGKEKEKYSF